ncbi:hypothetical protein B4U79_02721 [Dinothrombium tinctorium]|uniref:Ig-like domain-containing protein n=1 Tax=Dinothrombium tinctorium TaxID=1965070 RepID=A0A3S3SJE1_9ACAR|nr:hypothetical protein B4U79_02721 [Dinothrombium tinctorium]
MIKLTSTHLQIAANNGEKVRAKRCLKESKEWLSLQMPKDEQLCECVVKIQSLHVPKNIENGSHTNVILDCVYTLDENADRQLVVKWFVNDDPEPIYQWIPEYNSRHASNRWENRINLNYAVDTDSPLTKYRAVNLIRPTTDLSGIYSCHVMSWRSQDSKESEMIVYAPPKIFDFNYTRGIAEMPSTLSNTKGSAALESSGFHRNRAQRNRAGATLMCDISQVYPIPEVTIYRVDSDGTNPFILHVDNEIERISTHSYNVRVSSTVNDYELVNRFGKRQPSIFECLVTLPLREKKLFYKKRITYFPVVEIPPITNSIEIRSNPNFFVVASFAIAILVF